MITLVKISDNCYRFGGKITKYSYETKTVTVEGDVYSKTDMIESELDLDQLFESNPDDFDHYIFDEFEAYGFKSVELYDYEIIYNNYNRSSCLTRYVRQNYNSLAWGRFKLNSDSIEPMFWKDIFRLGIINHYPFKQVSDGVIPINTFREDDYMTLNHLIEHDLYGNFDIFHNGIVHRLSQYGGRHYVYAIIPLKMYFSSNFNLLANDKLNKYTVISLQNMKILPKDIPENGYLTDDQKLIAIQTLLDYKIKTKQYQKLYA